MIAADRPLPPPQQSLVFRLEPFTYYHNRYFNQLKEPVCMPKALIDLCISFTQTNFRQAMDNLSRIGTAPLPLFFLSAEEMTLLAPKKKPLLKELFRLMDTRNIKRIDAMELYTILLVLGKADYDSMLECAVDVFTSEVPSAMTRGELMFFLDSLFRAFSKLLIIRGQTAPNNVNVRLAAKDLNGLVTTIIPEVFIRKADFCKAFEAIPQLNELLRYIHLRVSLSIVDTIEHQKQHTAIENQVKLVIYYFYEEVDKALKAELIKPAQ